MFIHVSVCVDVCIWVSMSIFWLYVWVDSRASHKRKPIDSRLLFTIYMCTHYTSNSIFMYLCFHRSCLFSLISSGSFFLFIFWCCSLLLMLLSYSTLPFSFCCRFAWFSIHFLFTQRLSHNAKFTLKASSLVCLSRINEIWFWTVFFLSSLRFVCWAYGNFIWCHSNIVSIYIGVWMCVCCEHVHAFSLREYTYVTWHMYRYEFPL